MAGKRWCLLMKLIRVLTIELGHHKSKNLSSLKLFDMNFCSRRIFLGFRQQCLHIRQKEII